MDRLIYGGIAQLGERLNGIQEVSGSLPLISTKVKRHTKRCAFLFSFGGVEPHSPSPSGSPFSKGRASGGIPNLLPLAKVFDHAYFYGKRAWSAFSFH